MSQPFNSKPQATTIRLRRWNALWLVVIALPTGCNVASNSKPAPAAQAPVAITPIAQPQQPLGNPDQPYFKTKPADLSTAESAAQLAIQAVLNMRIYDRIARFPRAMLKYPIYQGVTQHDCLDGGSVELTGQGTAKLAFSAQDCRQPHLLDAPDNPSTALLNGQAHYQCLQRSPDHSSCGGYVAHFPQLQLDILQHPTTDRPVARHTAHRLNGQFQILRQPNYDQSILNFQILSLIKQSNKQALRVTALHNVNYTSQWLDNTTTSVVINGGLAVKGLNSVNCASGELDITTQVPVLIEAYNQIRAGALTLSNDIKQTAELEFQADGGMIVAIKDQAPVTLSAATVAGFCSQLR